MINSNYPKSNKISLIKRTNWILPHIVHEIPITVALPFYTDANKGGKAGCKSGNLIKVEKIPYNSVQRSNYVLFTWSQGFKRTSQYIVDSYYAERAILHIEIWYGRMIYILSIILNKCWLVSSHARSVGRTTRQEVELGQWEQENFGNKKAHS